MKSDAPLVGATEERTAKPVSRPGNERTVRRPRKGAVAMPARQADLGVFFGLSLLLGLILGLAGLLRIIGP